MSTANHEVRDLTIDELDVVSGGTVVEFRIGPAIFQFNLTNGGYAFWNGRTCVGDGPE